jgi:hypothetical protein
MRPVIDIAQFVLGEKNPPMHGLQPVPGIRNGPADDDAQGIFKIGFAQFFFYADLLPDGHEFSRDGFES